MTKTFDKLKAELLQIKEEYEMKDIISNLDARKAAIKTKQKEEMKLHKRLTASVKKAGEHMPGSLDFNSPEICIIQKKMYLGFYKIQLIWMLITRLN
jgi:hypothetical protein